MPTCFSRVYHTAICTDTDLTLIRTRISAEYPAAIPRAQPTRVALANQSRSVALTEEESRISCARCDVPLSGRNQFLGHMAISHEIAAEEAEAQWTRLTRDIVSRISPESSF